MELVLDIALWGMVIGIIHFFIVGILYQNPFVAKIYKNNEEHPGVKKWENKSKYILSMFLGTQVEIFIITAGYLILRNAFTINIINTIVVALIFAGIRVYPRFWNMWIQSTYPEKLLKVEVINGTFSTFVIVFGLYLLPV